MDDSTKIIKEYFEKLPPEMKRLVASQEWQNRVIDIGKKYSLNEKQVDDLLYEVLFVIIGMEPDTSLSTNIEVKLSVSKILSNEIINDLEERVFAQILESLDKKNGGTESKVPEIKPDNLPAIEVGEVAKPYTPEKTTSVGTFKPIEPVQKPYSVPRFGMSQVEPKVQVINMAQSKPQSPESMMANKMNNVTVNMGSDFMQKSTPAQPEAPKMPTTKYSADPYREPLN